MSPCPCGRAVCLRAMKLRLNGYRGIGHYIEHRDGSEVCPPGDWSSGAFKPYPKREEDRAWNKMLARWEATVVPPESKTA